MTMYVKIFLESSSVECLLRKSLGLWSSKFELIKLKKALKDLVSNHLLRVVSPYNKYKAHA